MIHRGFEAWIAYADGQRLPEHNIAFDGKKAICYIPSSRGKRFIICWKYHQGQHRAGVQVRIDGASVGCKTSRPGDTGKRIGMRTGSFASGAYHAFEFADLVTVVGDDGDRFVSLKGGEAQRGSPQRRRDKLGTICVRVYHIKPELEPPVPFPSRPVPFTGIRAIGEQNDEKEKAAGVADSAHCVRLGPKIRARWSEGAKEGAVMALLNKEDGPFISFEFRYRPASVLQANGIMPPFEAKSLATDEEEDESDSDEIEEAHSEPGSRAGHAPMHGGGLAATIKKCVRCVTRPSTGRSLR
ncbi:hypothetical protein PYCCODRAFT_1030733 [Trametes coccinea BRFM310]|uniref:DUF7918 domain-containing protein n=1 Tax=Trametes coccinea (strain BRFM310) TaxID=1353009 RepID=A0A1Y2IDX2_TRAC3|nr:hypothetical protein PYCCODRAFT_1030733 [Trametes coccinea BRFM310]